MKKTLVLCAFAALALAPAAALADIQPFQAQIITPAPAPRPVRRLTKHDFAVMDAQINREAARIARQWTGNHPGRPLTAAQMQAIRNQTCLVMAANNPDLRCVPGR